MASSMNGLTKSEHKVLKYLQFAFPGYAWCKTAGKGMLDFMGRPPADNNLPMLFVESKCGNDRARDSQIEWADSEFGVGCCKYVVYTPDDSSAWCVLYTWDDWLLFVTDRSRRVVRSALDSQGVALRWLLLCKRNASREMAG